MPLMNNDSHTKKAEKNCPKNKMCNTQVSLYEGDLSSQFSSKKNSTSEAFNNCEQKKFVFN